MKLTSQWVKDGVLNLGAFVSRFEWFAPNFSPLGSVGFFNKNGVTFFSFIVLYDLANGGFYPGFWLTYLGFAGYWVWGRLAKTRRQQLVMLPAASLTFFVLSNLGVWWYWYPHSVDALIRCFIYALPFYRNTFLGDLVFGYGYLAIRHWWVNRRPALASSTVNVTA